MFRLILKRLLLLIPVLIGVTFLVFSILSLAPGDPVLVVLGDNATEEAAEAMRSELGLDKPFLERYVNYIWDLLHGDFGKSYKTKLSVSDQILSRFPNTILLALSSMLIALLFGIPLGILSAKKQYTLLDNVASVGGLISVSMPNFWLGLLLVILFALKLRWLPSQGMGEGTGPMDPPCGDAGHRYHGDHHAYDALKCVGDHASGLCLYCPCKRHLRIAGHNAPYAEKCAHSYHHQRRPAVR